MNFLPDKFLYIVGIIAILCIVDKFVHTKNRIEYYIGILLLAGLMSIVYTLTGVSPLSGFHTSVNFNDIQRVPLFTIKQMMNSIETKYALTNIAGNILMFVPFGFLVPLVSVKMRRFFLTIPAGAFLSVCIELWQLLLVRGTDIDDVILNTSGVMLGYFVYFIFIHMCPKFGRRFESNKRKGFDWLTAGSIVVPAIVIIADGFYQIRS